MRNSNKPVGSGEATIPQAAAGENKPDSAEERRIKALIQAGLDSGDPIPVDAEFFDRLLAKIPESK